MKLSHKNFSNFRKLKEFKINFESIEQKNEQNFKAIIGKFNIENSLPSSFRLCSMILA